ncbi:phage tail tape measure protein [Pandoraea anapnoica]|uniref:phage tail tape measure protein n=1 Tax=Pandoraea anapnoica TaxID=2508301 RepID=UPI001FEAF5CA|nr:phage tail tape measure protein [Pandoraea anapnoica]
MRDESSGAARQAERNVQTAARQTGQAYVDASRVAVSATHSLNSARLAESGKAEGTIQTKAKQTGEVYVAATQTAISATRRLADARETLGARSDQAIRREIDQTIAAYSRLERAGFRSTEEQIRAFSSLQKKVAELNQEFGKVEKHELSLGHAAKGAMHIGEGVAGVWGATHAVADPVSRTMNFDQHLALMANTSYRDLTPQQRVGKTNELRQAIYAAVRQGGGSLEDATETLEKLLSHDTLGRKAAFDLLPKLQLGATAEGASAVELGNIAVKAVQNMHFGENDTGKVLDMTAVAGHMGEFKIPQLAQYLPAQMAAAANAGFSGAKGMAKILALNETAMSTAGSAGQAGDNVKDLLSQLSSTEFATRAKRAGIKNFDEVRTKTLAGGGDMLDAVVSMVQTTFKNDKQYQDIQAKLKTAKPGEQKELLTNMANLLQGSAIGKLFGNQQSVMALTGYMTQTDKRKEVYEAAMKEYQKGGGTIASDAQVAQSMDGYKVGKLKNEKEIGEMETVRGLNHGLGNASEKLAEYAQQYPGLTKAISATTMAFETLTMAVGAMGAFRMITGGGSAAAAGVAGEAASVVGGVSKAGVATEAVSMGAKAMKGAKLFGKLAAPLQIATTAYEAWNVAHDDTKTAAQKHAAYVGVAGKAIGGVAGAMAGGAAGGAAGAAIGSVVPVVGTAIGGAVGMAAGAVGGYFGSGWGEKLGKMIGDALFAEKKTEKAAAPQPIVINLDGHQIAQAVNKVNQQMAERH